MSFPIDTAHLDKYISGDASLRDEILTIFQEQIDSLRVRIDVEADDEEWYNVMHSMKGASRGIGAWSIGDICEKGEDFVSTFPDKETARINLQKELDGGLDIVVADAIAIRDGKERPKVD